MKGLAPHTKQVFEAVSKLDCIRPYLLVGGTALSLQIGTRQSEDLDFMKWRSSKAEKMEVAWYQIEKELADVKSIGAMKMEVMLRRSNFRDYYDIYSTLKSGVSINDLISLALSYSGHKLKSKNPLAILSNGSRFARDAHFEQLEPIYAVTAKEIEHYIKSSLL